MDWHQLWEIASTPDNVPIVALIPLLIFFSYLAVKQGRANDQLIGELETSPALAKTHHRKTWPFKPGWQKEVHVWPFLLRIELLATIIVTELVSGRVDDNFSIPIAVTVAAHVTLALVA